MKAYQTRRLTFSACHRLNSSQLTSKENEELYGKCNHPNGHGHNYIVNVTLFGPIDERTGMIMNMSELKELMNEAIMRPMDHKNLDLDVDYFKNKPSTTENVAIFVWQNLLKLLTKSELLYEVEIQETENNSVRYRGD